MKIRWTRNSLRLRITPSELAALLRGAPVCETLGVPGGCAAPLWRVELEPNAPDTRLIPCGSSLRLSLSAPDLLRLAEPETEGIYFTAEDDFRWFIEKDFPCIHPRALEALETPTETFSPPPDFEARKAAK